MLPNVHLAIEQVRYLVYAIVSHISIIPLLQQVHVAPCLFCHLSRSFAAGMQYVSFGTASLTVLNPSRPIAPTIIAPTAKIAMKLITPKEIEKSFISFWFDSTTPLR